MSTSWNGQICNDEGKYYIQFETDNKELYRLVESTCQLAMDIDRNPEIIDKLINTPIPKYKALCKICGKPAFYEDITSEGICIDCDKLQHPEDYDDKLTPEEFVETYCHNCGSQRCEGIGTVWFKGCRHKQELKEYEIHEL